MNTDWFSIVPESYTDSQGDPQMTPSLPALSDFRLTWYAPDLPAVAAPVSVPADDLVLEYASEAVKAFRGDDPGDTIVRFRGLPFSATRMILLVEWEVDNVTPLIPLISGAIVGGEPEEVNVLYGLLATTPGLTPVHFDFREAGSGDPVGGVEITVWDSTLDVPLIPLLRTTVGGRATCGLPPGAYKVFAYKPYSSFTDEFPVDLTVGVDVVILSMTLSQARPALPVVPKVTVFGWVLRPDFVPVPEAEVKLRLLNTPQMSNGGGGLTRFEITAFTDAEGRFELYPIGGITALLTCEATGYSRKGVLPLSGSLNWANFAKETIGH